MKSSFYAIFVVSVVFVVPPIQLSVWRCFKQELKIGLKKPYPFVDVKVKREFFFFYGKFIENVLYSMRNHISLKANNALLPLWMLLVFFKRLHEHESLIGLSVCYLSTCTFPLKMLRHSTKKNNNNDDDDDYFE